MQASRYGTVPLVRETGGFKDSVTPYETDGRKGNGFVFKDYKSDNVIKVISKACAVYNDKENWEKLVKQVMECDFSWNRSAKEYIKIYNKLLENKIAAPYG